MPEAFPDPAFYPVTDTCFAQPLGCYNPQPDRKRILPVIHHQVLVSYRTAFLVYSTIGWSRYPS